MPAKPGFDWRDLAMEVVPPIIGTALLIGISALHTLKRTTLSPLISLLRVWLPIGLLAFNRQSGRDLDHIRLLDLADGHRQRGRRDAHPDRDSVIGVVGMLLEWLLVSLAKRFDYDEG